MNERDGAPIQRPLHTVVLSAPPYLYVDDEFGLQAERIWRLGHVYTLTVDTHDRYCRRVFTGGQPVDAGFGSRSIGWRQYDDTRARTAVDTCADRRRLD